MPKHRIKIGNQILESRKEFPWTKIMEIASHLKKVANWNPEEKVWIINWRLFSRFSDFLELVNNIIRNEDEIYATELIDLLERLLSFVSKEKIDDNRILLLALDIDPYDLAKEMNEKQIKIRVIREVISVPNIGDIEVPYIEISIETIYNVVKRGKIEILPDFIREVVSKIDIEAHAPKVRVYPISARRIIVDFPFNPPKALIDELTRIGQFSIFQEDSSGKLVEKTYNLSKVKRDRVGSVRIILPSYAIAFIDRVFSRYGIPAQIDYGLRFRALGYVNPDFKLMNHQQEALNAWIANSFKGTVVIPTGGGKTHVALAAIAHLRLPTIIFVPNKWLLNQWVKMISEYLRYPKGLIGVLGAGKKNLKDITVSTYQSGYRYVEELTDKFVLAIFDEAHHVPAKTFKEVALNLRAIHRMALSATPKRRDRNEVLLFKLVGHIVYTISYRELVLKGVVAPVIVRKIFVKMPADKYIVYKQYQRKANAARNEFDRRVYVNKMIEIARDNPLKLDVIKDLAKKHEDEKIFIFAGSIDFAEKIEKELRSITHAALLTSKTERSKEERIISNFQKGVIKCLILVKKGEEGVDVGDASVAIIAGGSKQERELIQRVGRILRGGKEKLAVLYEIVSEGTIDEALSRARNTKKIVEGIEDIILERYKEKAYLEIKWGEEKL